MKAAATKRSPGNWTVGLMVDADTREPLTPEQVGEYVKNSIIKTAEESGTTDFLFVFVEREDGARDICHVGNGPRGPVNALLIAAAPEMLAALKRVREALALSSRTTDRETVAGIDAAIAKAEGGAS